MLSTWDFGLPVGADSNSKQPTNNAILSLDDSGVRGYVSLLILQALMDQINLHETARNAQDPDKKRRICDYFDFIVGAGTGGIIAIMLGRLKMSVRDCFNEFDNLTGEIFRQPRHIVSRHLRLTRRQQDISILEERIKDLITRQAATLGETGPVTLKSPQDNCKT
ncbi:MAG: hypothetical protein Q9162_006074 [Coniocarpon cinnabarinum]